MRNDYFTGKSVCFVAAGAEHSLAVTLGGLLYSWGSNSKGQLCVCTLGRDFRRIGLPRLIDTYLKVPITLVACGPKTSFFTAAGRHAEVSGYMFALWRKKLLQEERRAMEDANYRYSIVRRTLNREKLMKQINNEREVSLSRLSLNGDTSRHSAPDEVSESYYEFWNPSSFLTLEDSSKWVYTYDHPHHSRRRGGVTVTVFKGFPSAEVRSPTTPLYSRYSEFSPAVRRFQTLKTQTLFPPYCLSPNPVLLAPGKPHSV